MCLSSASLESRKTRNNQDICLLKFVKIRGAGGLTLVAAHHQK